MEEEEQASREGHGRQKQVGGGSVRTVKVPLLFGRTFMKTYNNLLCYRFAVSSSLLHFFILSSLLCFFPVFRTLSSFFSSDSSHLVLLWLVSSIIFKSSFLFVHIYR